MPLKTLQHDARHLCYHFIPEPAALRDRSTCACSTTRHLPGIRVDALQGSMPAADVEGARHLICGRYRVLRV
ncbi:hypothetical protein CFRS1_v011644 [Colletotrichum fructicola]|nr:hypothetical protein CFRS1_v011644 [Colletotrichum fructicola]